ncbi:hypothetical protein [Polluticoccus soli]|uniref:hypothetical protein n=1 Tax=Polluticoccus soli TaxID=3034150 RepID=UPI0023E2137C|nr:hypothetical protein [Flavipsychrobacter sp. JY13-12]
MAPMNCFGDLYDHFGCYNDVVEQLMRRRLMRNFPRLIEHKADSLLRKMSSEVLYEEVSRRRHE